MQQREGKKRKRDDVVRLSGDDDEEEEGKGHLDLKKALRRLQASRVKSMNNQLADFQSEADEGSGESVANDEETEASEYTYICNSNQLLCEM